MAEFPTIIVEIPWPLTREELNYYKRKYNLRDTHEVVCLGETIMPDGSIIVQEGIKNGWWKR